MTDKGAALQSLTPSAQWVLRGEVIEWLDSEQDQPTDKAIQSKIIELQSQYDSQAYARSRKVEYDKLNQDEMRYDDLVNSTTTWQDAIAAIKTSIPKG
jgi:hypothetical protein|tara:strand:- start:239 stop:532 length:294 start_codon:yes stop_codon:yes gene_type:complete